MSAAVEHPPHYVHGSIECIDAIESALGPAGFAGFCAGNAMKYLWRYRQKNGLEDLQKARWYLARLIQHAGGHDVRSS